MLTISTYLVKPYLSLGANYSELRRNPAVWLRKHINEIMNPRKSELKNENIPTEIFFNHDEQTGALIPDYPLIQYHYIKNNFYVSGINEGALALAKLIEIYNKDTVKINRDFYLNFTPVSELSSKTKICNTTETFDYCLYNWLPFCKTNYDDYKALKSLDKKILKLEERLKINLAESMGKKLNMKLGKTKVKITDVDSFKRKWICITDDKKFNHCYKPFSVCFETNLLLPPMLTVGNRKALGYGRIIPKTNHKPPQ